MDNSGGWVFMETVNHVFHIAIYVKFYEPIIRRKIIQQIGDAVPLYFTVVNVCSIIACRSSYIIKEGLRGSVWVDIGISG